MSIEPPKPSPEPPKGPGETTQPGIASKEYVVRKLAEAEAHVERVAREAARSEHNGKPVVSKVLTPWFFAGFIMCGSITTVAMSFEDEIPRWVLIASSVGAMFFGGMLGLTPGLRR